MPEGPARIPHDQALLDRVLIEAAEAAGDITPLVMERLYADLPEARALFADSGYGPREETEIKMASSALYCIMDIVENPVVVRYFLEDEVERHSGVGVPTALFWGLISATLKVLEAHLEPQFVEGRALLQRLEGDLHAMVLGAPAA
jgi:hypothetical protein